MVEGSVWSLGIRASGEAASDVALPEEPGGLRAWRLGCGFRIEGSACSASGIWYKAAFDVAPNKSIAAFRVEGFGVGLVVEGYGIGGRIEH